jgi:hypothetical protein
MANLKLFINTSANQLVAGQNSTQLIEPGSIPLFFGDTLLLNIYLLQVPIGWDARNPMASGLETVPTNGLQLFFYIDDGTIGGTIYTQQIAFAEDPSQRFFIGTLALNTAALQTLIGANTGAPAWIKIGYVQNGVQTTVLSARVTINVGLPLVALAVPAALTPLSAEVANATYYPQLPVAGMPLLIKSPAGHTFALVAVDNADGTSSTQLNQID